MRYAELSPQWKNNTLESTPCISPAKFMQTLHKFATAFTHWVPIFLSFQVTHSSVVPPVVLLLAKHPAVDNYDLSNLTEITNGAAPLGEEISKEVMKRLPLLSRVRQGKKSGFQTSLGSSKVKVIMSFPSPDRLRHDRTKSSMSHDSFWKQQTWLRRNVTAKFTM